jgi:hypothetical protein
MLISEKNTNRRLRPAEQRFVENIAAGMTQTAAYKEAYPKASDASARACASQKLTDPNIQAAVIQERKDQAASAAGVTVAMVVGGVAELAFGSIADIPFVDGHVDWERARESGVDKLIKSIRVQRHTTKDGRDFVTTNIELYSRLDALKELGDYLGVKQKPRENDAEIEKVARAYKSWRDRHPNATEEERRLYLQEFAKGGSVPVEALESRVQDLGSQEQ